ncbi:MAG: hypothetical protein V4581_12540 [Bacteroidota bacterium]
MKKHLSNQKNRITENQRSRAKKNNIIIGIQIATVSIVLTMIFASIYNNA